MAIQKIGLSFVLFLAAISAWLQKQPEYHAVLPPNEFAFGARVDAQAPQLDLALNLAVGIEMGWVSQDLDWAVIWPDPAQSPDLTALQTMLDLAQERKLRVLVSLQNPPAWAMLEFGPDPEHTAELLLQLVAANPGSLGAVELFPGANTLAGWKRTPDPIAYAQLFAALQAHLAAPAPDLLLIPSLQPLQFEATSSTNLDARAFLQAFYQAVPTLRVPLIGIHFAQLSGLPVSAPATDQPVVLRQYELIRQVMLQNNRTQDLIWITSFSWPKELADQAQQAEWATTAFSQLRAQPFLTAAFFNSLNDTSTASLILPQLTLHPASETIAHLNASHTVVFSR